MKVKMDNREKLFAAVAGIFNVDSASISEASSPDTVKGWDSLAMVNLVAELEQVFDVQFDILEIADFHNVGIIRTILADKGVSFE